MKSTTKPAFTFLAALLSVAFFAPSLRAAPAAPHSRDVVTQGNVTVAGKTIPYTAHAGTLILRNADQQPIASVFYAAYWKSNVKNEDSRPITFAYNGGPGSSSVWLHLGGLGPRRLEVPSDAKPVSPPPYRLANNPYSILDTSTSSSSTPSAPV